eukprot:gene10939-12100_t
MGEDSNVAVAIYDYKAQDNTELTIQKNEKLIVLDDSQAWWRVKSEKNLSGYVPSNYLERKGSKKGGIMGQLKNKIGGKPNKDKPSGNESQTVANKMLGKSGSKILAICIGKYNYEPQRDDELCINRGDQVLVLEKEKDGWWLGERNGKTGWFPNNYVDIIDAKETAPQSEYALPSDVMPGFNGSQQPQQQQSDQIISKVRTLYAFTSQSSEELSFERDVILEIIEKSKHDPDWWKARSSQGKIGLVPRNYVQEVEIDIPEPSELQMTSPNIAKVDATATTHAFANQEWFHGKLMRVECEQLLHNYGKDGEFLLRESESRAGDYSLSMKAPNRIKHFRIKSDDNQFVIGQRSFDSMQELISHYKTSPIYTMENGDKMFLGVPFNRAITKSRQ